MGAINLLGATWPGGLWATLIKLFYSFITNYAWAIIVFTVCLKLLLSPIDFLQKRSTAKTQKANALIQPEMDKLQKRYANNPQMMKQKQAELYKKNGINMGGTCFVMLLYIVSTFVIFMTLFNSLGTISRFKITDQYEQLRTTYYNSVSINTENKNYIQLAEELNGVSADKKAVAEQAVVDKYQEIKDTWLWVKNIWISDSVANRIPDFKAYLNASGTTFEVEKDSGITVEQLKSAAEAEYNAVMNTLLKEHNGVNGYYILSVLAVLISALTQFFNAKMMQPKSKNPYEPKQKQKTNWFMMILLPAIMLVFTLTSSAAFSVYIITSSLISTLLMPLIMFISNKMDAKAEEKKKAAIKVDYRR